MRKILFVFSCLERGLAPKRRAAPTAELDENEIKEMLKRGGTERERIDVERQEGLGAAP